VVAQAQDWLREAGRARGSGDPGMGIELDPADAPSWDVLRTYAPWSINVDLVADADRMIAWLHDCGCSVTAELTADEAVQVTRQLADIAPSSRYMNSGTRQSREGHGEGGATDQAKGAAVRTFRRS
jgi:hypothetical protein